MWTIKVTLHNEFPLDCWDRTGWKRNTQLFDPGTDPDERSNPAADPSLHPLCSEMQAIVNGLPVPFRWNEAVESPLRLSISDEEKS